MKAPIIVLSAWLLFAGTHLLLGLPLRARLVRKLGEQRFVALFSAIATVTMGLLAAAVARFGGEGPVGFALAQFPSARALVGIIAFLGITLAIAGMMNYMRSPMALFRTQMHPPSGIERVTRHAFFMGLAVFAIAHAVLAPTLAVAIYFAGFAALAGGGALWQDRKLIGRYGDWYVSYMRATSVLPFVALLQRRQAFVADDRIGRRLLVSAAIALLLLATHRWWSAFNGATFASVMAVGGACVSARRWWHSRARRIEGLQKGSENTTNSSANVL